jgi:uncharacterized protein (TIGR02594 family)
VKNAVELFQQHAEAGEFEVDGQMSDIGEKLSGEKKGVGTVKTQEFAKKVVEKKGKVPEKKLKDPKWIQIAKAELGQKEIAGAVHNERIVEYHKTTTLPDEYHSDEVAWCSSFINWCMKQAGYTGTGSARAKDWIKWGQKLTMPVYGAIAVIDYGVDANGVDRGGHVGFVVGKKENGSLILLGGNQGKQGQGSVNETPYRTNKIVGYILPEGYAITNFDVPTKKPNKEEGTYETTR